LANLTRFYRSIKEKLLKRNRLLRASLCAMLDVWWAVQRLKNRLNDQVSHE